MIPTRGKILVTILFNSIYEYLEEKNLLCENHSGFRSSDSCEYQRLSIVHDINSSLVFDPPLNVRGAFFSLKLMIVWHDELLIHIIKCVGMNGMLLESIKDFAK